MDMKTNKRIKCHKNVGKPATPVAQKSIEMS